MQLDNIPNRVWYVHTDNGTRFDSMWTTRNEARQRKNTLGTNGIKLSYVQLDMSALIRDDHS